MTARVVIFQQDLVRCILKGRGRTNYDIQIIVLILKITDIREFANYDHKRKHKQKC